MGVFIYLFLGFIILCLIFILVSIYCLEKEYNKKTKMYLEVLKMIYEKDKN